MKQDPSSLVPLVVHLAGKVWGPHDHGSASFKDAVSEGILALYRSNKRFKKSRNTRMITYSYRRVQGAMLDLRIRENKYIHRFAPVGDLESDKWMVPAKSLEGLISDSLLFRKVLVRMERLPSYHKHILFRSFLKEQRDREIADGLDISVYMVDKLRTEALQMMRAEFALRNGSGVYLLASDK